MVQCKNVTNMLVIRAITKMLEYSTVFLLPPMLLTSFIEGALGFPNIRIRLTRAHIRYTTYELLRNGIKSLFEEK